MARVFLSSALQPLETADITGGDALHLSRVLRLRVGDKLTVCDTNGFEYPCTIETIGDSCVRVRLGEKRASDSEPSCPVVVYQCLPKGDKLETVVQKATELGATAIIPVLSERCVSRPDARSMQQKVVRLRKIAESAASQCGRGRIPEVGEAVTFAQACDGLHDGLCFICYEGEGTEFISRVATEKSYSRIAFLIGPEGGLAQSEVDKAALDGIPLVGLGKRILRTETASAFVLSALAVLTKNFCVE